MGVYHNGPDNFMDQPEGFLQYICWLLSEHKGTNIQTSINQIGNAHLDRVSNSHVFTNINMFNYTRPVNWKVQIQNDIKDHAKGFLIVIINTPTNNNYITMAIILHATKSTKHNKPNITQTLQPIQKY